MVTRIGWDEEHQNGNTDCRRSVLDYAGPYEGEKIIDVEIKVDELIRLR